jgi:hypothetical protein
MSNGDLCGIFTGPKVANELRDFGIGSQLGAGGSGLADESLEFRRRKGFVRKSSRASGMPPVEENKASISATVSFLSCVAEFVDVGALLLTISSARTVMGCIPVAYA